MDILVQTGQRSQQRHQIVSDTLEEKLLKAIQNGEDVGQIKRLINCGADISCAGDGHWTPLTIASYLGQIDIVVCLLAVINQVQGGRKPKCSPDSPNEGGLTPLIAAALKGHVDVCTALLEAGASVNGISPFSGQTPLLVAVDNNQVQVAKKLLEWNADVQMTDNVGISPLYAAVDRNNPELVRDLIIAGCDVNIGSQDHAPLFLAARRGYLPIVQMLCKAGCFKTIANKYGVTPLYEAAFKGQNEVLNFLIQQGCDVNCYDMYSVSPMQAATLMGNLQAVQALLQGGALLKWRDHQGRCAVQMSVDFDKASIFKFFLEQGVDISKQPYRSWRMSSISSVFEKGFMATATVLLQGCSDLDLRDLTYLHLTREHPVLLELMLASGLRCPPQLLLQEVTAVPSVKFSPECQQWLIDFYSKPQSLKTLSRSCIRRRLGNIILYATSSLPLPTSLQKFVTFHHLNQHNF